MTDGRQFGEHEEEAIISLILDYPEIYVGISKFLDPTIFSNPIAAFVLSAIKSDFDAHGVIPSRKLLFDKMSRSLTVEDDYEPILQLVNRESDPREVPFIREHVKDWAEHRTFDLLYSDAAIAAHNRGDHTFLRQIFDEASRLNHSGSKAFWLFKQIDELFVQNAVEHIKTGFRDLDKCLNDGGPSTGEVLVWLAPTGVGKCHSLESKIIEEKLSRIYEIEVENAVVKLAGFREIQTARGAVRVCDLEEGDDITSLPIVEDKGDIQLSAM